MYRSRKIALFRGREELSDQIALLFVADAGEQLRSELDHGLWSIKWEPLVHLPAREVTRLAAREDRLDLRFEIRRGRGMQLEENQ